MIRRITRLVGIGCFAFCAYQGYLWWTANPAPAINNDDVRAIVRGNGDGTETVLWEKN